MRSLKSLIAWTAVLVVNAMVASTMASPMRFQNPAGPGHFSWQPQSSGASIVLKITASPSAQSAALTEPATFRQAWSGVSNVVINASNATSNAVQGMPVPSNAFRTAAGGIVNEVVPYLSPASFVFTAYIHRDNAVAGDPEFCFPAGERRFLGVQFNPGDGIHYGWIGVVRTGNFLDPFAWAYESMPNTPITVPEPSALLLLGVGGLIAARRRG